MIDRIVIPAMIVFLLAWSQINLCVVVMFGDNLFKSTEGWICFLTYVSFLPLSFMYFYLFITDLDTQKRFAALDQRKRDREKHQCR